VFEFLDSSKNLQNGVSQVNLHKETIHLIVVAAIFALPIVLYRPLRRFVPPVVLFIIVGLLFGKTVFGKLFPEFYQVFSVSGVPEAVTAIGQWAVSIFVFMVGLHLCFKEFRDSKNMVALMATSLTSLVVPFLTGFALGWWFGQYTELLGPQATRFTYGFSSGILLSVTALPVLAMITERMGYANERVGKIAILIATFKDGALWAMLAVLMALASLATAGSAGLYSMVGLTILYGLFMFYPVRYALRFVDERGWLHDNAELVALAVVVMAVSAAVTDYLGLHTLLGMVIAGMVFPDRLKHRLLANIGKAVEDWLMPFFFVSAGLVTEVPLQANGLFWGLAISSTVITIIANLFPTAWMARVTGLLSPMESYKLGAFTSAKGLMELVVLKALLTAGLISVTTFGALTVMAVLSTAATMPLVLLCKKLMHRRDSASSPTSLETA
jgi:Kef-type K+ transport system membrane component KefB